MPDTFVSVPIETDPDAITQIAYDYMQTQFPLWVPADDQLDSSVLSSGGRQTAELRDVASDVPPSIFRYFGGTLAGLPPIDASPATVSVTINAVDATGLTIPAGAAAGLRDASGVLQSFETSIDVVIPAGVTLITPVTMVASTEGAASTGLGTTGDTMEPISSIADIASIVILGPSAGGTDAELDSDYLDRLAQDLSLQSPRPILPGDFAIYSRNTPGVYRALALDGYDAIAATSGNARTITVAVVDINGDAVGSPVKTAVAAALTAAREVNFLVYVIDPTYTTIDVTYSVTMYPGYASADIQAACDAALGAFLNPATWGISPIGDPTEWLQQTKAKINDIIVILGNVVGVNDVNAVTIRPGSGAYAAVDITLGGAAPLPRLGVTVPTVM